MTETSTSELSERELEILKLIATGASNKDIAQRLVISPNTVKVHLRNIFAKIGVVSRTEAAMYAVRIGLIPSPVPSNPQDLVIDPVMSARIDAPGAGEIVHDIPQTISSEANPESFMESRNNLPFLRWLVISLFILIAIGIIAGSWDLNNKRVQQLAVTLASTQRPTTTPVPRWKAGADLTTARFSLAAAVYENKIYIIGGTTRQGITGLTEDYDPSKDTWKELAKKPVPVTDVGAAVIGGLIYVPGGLTASKYPTNTLEAYNPLQDRWEKHAPLPVAISAYALVAYEGRLFLFGGWDGRHYLNSVFEYDPSRDGWTAKTPMPTRRGFASAVVSASKIYVLGGFDGEKALSSNEIYQPDLDGDTDSPWSSGISLPDSRYGLETTSIADTIYVLGGEGERGGSYPPLQFNAQQNAWDTFESPHINLGSHFGLVPYQSRLYVMGGQSQNEILANNLVYQAIYTIIVPLTVP